MPFSSSATPTATLRPTPAITKELTKAAFEAAYKPAKRPRVPINSLETLLPAIGDPVVPAGRGFCSKADLANVLNKSGAWDP